MPIYVCERTFPTAITEADFQVSGAALVPCLEARDVKWVASHVSADGLRSVCVFEAADAERVRDANRHAGMPFDKVWQAHLYKA